MSVSPRRYEQDFEAPSFRYQMLPSHATQDSLRISKFVPEIVLETSHQLHVPVCIAFTFSPFICAPNSTAIRSTGSSGSEAVASASTHCVSSSLVLDLRELWDL